MWLQSIKRTDINCSPEKLNKNFKVCGTHFSTKMFKNDLRNRLFDHAYPDINVGEPNCTTHEENGMDIDLQLQPETSQFHNQISVEVHNVEDNSNCIQVASSHLSSEVDGDLHAGNIEANSAAADVNVEESSVFGMLAIKCYIYKFSFLCNNNFLHFISCFI